MSRHYGLHKWGTTGVTLTLGTDLVNVIAHDDEVRIEPTPAYLLQVTALSGTSRTRVVAATIEDGEFVPAIDSWNAPNQEYIGTALTGTEDYDALVAAAQEKADAWKAAHKRAIA